MTVGESIRKSDECLATWYLDTFLKDCPISKETYDHLFEELMKYFGRSVE